MTKSIEAATVFGMTFPSVDQPPYLDPANTARQTRARYRFQDECVTLRCVQNLATDGLRAVVVEWSSDYLAFPTDGPAELVSIKHREPHLPRWSASNLEKPIADLYRYWRQMPPPCRCVFVSNIGVGPTERLPARLAEQLGILESEARRFVAEDLDFPPVVPHRSHISAIAVDTMRGTLRALNRDPRYADDCYTTLLDRVRQVSIELPPTVRARATRLAGSMRAVLAAHQPNLPAQTLTLADLRALVEITHDDLAGEPGSSAPSPPAAASPEWAGGREVRLECGEFLLHDPVETGRAPDDSYRWYSAPARQLAPVGRDVRLRQVRVRRDTPSARQRRNALRREASLLQQLALGSLELLATAEDATGTTVVIRRPTGHSLSETLGPLDDPYPAAAMTALLQALPTLGQVLGSLHQHGHAHRDLRPETLLVTGRRLDLVPRDVGLATVPAVPGEGPAGYRAPEQERPLVTPPAPPTDAYQLAAIVYHALTGHQPGPRPLPPSLLRPDLAPAVDAVLLPALAAESAARPPVPELCDNLARLASTALVSPP